jgi:hypothetical protein
MGDQTIQCAICICCNQKGLKLKDINIWCVVCKKLYMSLDKLYELGIQT